MVSFRVEKITWDRDFLIPYESRRERTGPRKPWTTGGTDPPPGIRDHAEIRRARFSEQRQRPDANSWPQMKGTREPTQGQTTRATGGRSNKGGKRWREGSLGLHN